MGTVQENSGNTGALAAPTSFDVTLPAPTVAGAGRYVVIIVSCDDVVDAPPGFVVDEDQVNNAGHYVFRADAPAGADTWTVEPGSGGAASWYVAELDELDPDDPRDTNAHTSQGTGASGSTWSTGTTGTPTQDDLHMIASFSMSVSGETDVTATGFTNDFIGVADEFTGKASGTDIGLYVAAKQISAAAAQECTVTYSAPGARTGIMVGYKIAAAAESSEVTIAGSLPAPLTGSAAVESSSVAAIAGSLPAPLAGAVTAVGEALAVIAGVLPAPLTGSGTVQSSSAAAVAGSLPALAGAVTLSAGDLASPPLGEIGTATVRRSQGTAWPRRIIV